MTGWKLVVFIILSKRCSNLRAALHTIEPCHQRVIFISFFAMLSNIFAD